MGLDWTDQKPSPSALRDRYKGRPRQISTCMSACPSVTGAQKMRNRVTIEWAELRDKDAACPLCHLYSTHTHGYLPLVHEMSSQPTVLDQVMFGEGGQLISQPSSKWFRTGRGCLSAAEPLFISLVGNHSH